MTFFSLHHIASLWIELHTHRLRFIVGIDALLHRFHVERILLVAVVWITLLIEARINGQIGIVTFCSRRLEHREYPREHSIHAPVRHVTRISTHFIKARTKQRVNLHVTMCLPLLVDIIFVRLNHVTTRIQQLHIQNFAHIRRTSIVSTRHIRLEPNRLPFKIASIVKVHIHFLLRHSPVETHHMLHIRDNTLCLRIRSRHLIDSLRHRPHRHNARHTNNCHTPHTTQTGSAP